jgi:hypothetical protein
LLVAFWVAGIVVVVVGPLASRARGAPASPEPASRPASEPASEPASPPPPPPPKPKTFAKLQRASLSHEMQFGLAVMPGSGYRGIFPYKEGIYCGKTQDGMFRRVCSAHVPFFIDLQPSFGIGLHWDLLVDLRFGLEADFTKTHQFAVAPGFRYWVDPQLHAKFFATVQVAYDTTAQHQSTITNNDVAFRNSNGFMYDVMRNIGFYGQFGETIGFVRWLRFEVDLGIGVQVRFP